jgi:spore germination protein GerM
VGRIVVALIAVLAIAGGAWWYFSSRGSVAGDHLTVYYSKLEGKDLGMWTVSTRGSQPGESAAEHLHNSALYAAVQAVAGPPSDVQAIRFPPGTHVLNVNVTGDVATVDLSKDVAAANAGVFEENGEFKGLVYTLTGITSVNAVQITIEGRKVETLPGGHLELDTPLRRSDW